MLGIFYRVDCLRELGLDNKESTNIFKNIIMNLVKKLTKLSLNKKARVLNYSGFVPTKGIEPSHPCEWQILSLLRLPVPPHGLHEV